MVRRSAFTLIELIFAIVVISISVMSLPTMTQSINKGIEGNIVQEAIFAASTELNQAVAANWDDNSLADGNNSYARVINISGDCDNNITSATYRLRPGHIKQELHRKCLDDTTVVALSGTAVTGLEHYQKTDAGLSNPAVNQAGYKFSYTTTVTVTPDAIFGTSVANGNIKMIEAKVSESGNLITSLKTYSANIGEVDFYKRTY